MAEAAPTIKMDEEEEGLPSPIADEVEYEDIGELEIPKDLPRAWMIKVPRFLYENWSKIEDEEPVQLGVVRRYESGKTKILLDPVGKYSKKIPLEYDMREQPAHGNTFLFSEKDLPAYSKRSRVKKDPLAPQGHNGTGKRGKQRQWRSRTVPKQTKLAATAAHEAQWFPVESQDFRRIMAQRMADEESNKAGVEMLVGDARLFGGSMLRAGGKILSRPAAVRKDGGFSDFVKTNVPVTKPQQNKAVRIPETELMDILFDLYGQYRYYTVKGLRERVNQPEEYIRTVMNKIGTYEAKGDHVGTFRLNDDNERARGVGQNAIAPKVEENVESGMDNDADDAEMEDSATSSTSAVSERSAAIGRTSAIRAPRSAFIAITLLMAGALGVPAGLNPHVTTAPVSGIGGVTADLISPPLFDFSGPGSPKPSVRWFKHLDRQLLRDTRTADIRLRPAVADMSCLVDDAMDRIARMKLTEGEDEEYKHDGNKPVDDDEDDTAER